MTTIGEMLTNADARFKNQGGYRADALCDEHVINLIFRSPCGVETIVDSTPFTQGLAGEDIAHDLLAKRIGEKAATETYFVITYK